MVIDMPKWMKREMRLEKWIDTIKKIRAAKTVEEQDLIIKNSINKAKN